MPWVLGINARDAAGAPGTPPFEFPVFTDWEGLSDYPEFWAENPSYDPFVFHANGVSATTNDVYSVALMDFGGGFTDNEITLIGHTLGQPSQMFVYAGGHAVSLTNKINPAGFYGSGPGVVHVLTSGGSVGESWAALVRDPSGLRLYAADTASAVVRTDTGTAGDPGFCTMVDLELNREEIRAKHTYIHNVALSQAEVEDVWRLMDWAG